MTTNIRNYGIAIGRLAQEVKVGKLHRDGSVRVFFTLACPNNYKNSDDGSRDAQFISFTAFLPSRMTGLTAAQVESAGPNACKLTPGLGPFSLLHKGDLIAVQYHIESSSYVDKQTGETKYVQNLCAQSIDFLESQQAVADRQKRLQQESAGVFCGTFSNFDS